MVVAFVDQSTCKTFAFAHQAPDGSTVFSSPEEMGSALATHTMDLVRGKLLGETVEPSPSRDLAAKRLWHVLTLGADIGRIDWSSKSYQPVKDAFGNRKVLDVSPIDLIQLIWVPGKDHMVDHFYKKMPPQEKQVVQMLIDDGRGIWTNAQADAVIEARAHEVKTKMSANTVFGYYKSDLFYKKILKRVSFKDFAAKPEFAESNLST